MLLACGPSFGPLGLLMLGATWCGGPVLAGAGHMLLRRGNLRHRVGVALTVNGGLLSAGVLALVARASGGMIAAAPPLMGLVLTALALPRLRRKAPESGSFNPS